MLVPHMAYLMVAEIFAHRLPVVLGASHSMVRGAQPVSARKRTKLAFSSMDFGKSKTNRKSSFEATKHQNKLLS